MGQGNSLVGEPTVNLPRLYVAANPMWTQRIGIARETVIYAAETREQAARLIRYKFRSGFTLIELLIVVAIIALLAEILYPICLSNYHQVGLPIHQYSND